jgi:hypothetical protein
MNPKSLKNGRRSVGSSGALVRGVSIHNPVTGGECASSTPSLLINYRPPRTMAGILIAILLLVASETEAVVTTPT